MRVSLIVLLATAAAHAGVLTGIVTDPQGRTVAGAIIAAADVVTTSGPGGRYSLGSLPAGRYQVRTTSPGFQPVTLDIALGAEPAELEIRFQSPEASTQSLTVTAETLQPGIDLRSSEVFSRTLFTRDDQVFQQLAAGISAGQHEGGGKSLEIRRFGFNLDHGGVNGGLKVLVDNVQQNQGTQGHGQGYLGSLKALSPELIQEVDIVDGPFSAQYGDFSGLGVVHIRQRESLPDTAMVRLEGGRFDTGRGFFGWSPNARAVDSYLAYETAYTNGPFLNSGRYRRDNLNGNYTRTLRHGQKAGFRILGARNNFHSSGQLPLDLVDSGELSRFGFIDPSLGGRVKSLAASAYYTKTWDSGAVLRADGFLSRSLFDLYSNFTFFLNDPDPGDAFQQHDSRLQHGANLQYSRAHRLGGRIASFSAGGNFHDNRINVGLYPQQGRVPLGVTSRANARVTNEAGYAQEAVTFWQGRLSLTGGLRYDSFRYHVTDRVNPASGGVQYAGRWQVKGGAALTPVRALPLTLHLNYGRGINSADARGVVARPDGPRLATTDFVQAGVSHSARRYSLSADVFRIAHSNEQVYIPDDGSFEFRGASLAYGIEGKASISVTRRVSLSGGLTKIGNSFFRDGETRSYVVSAPRFTANAALTVAQWRGWSGSLRMRAINHYRLDEEDPSILAQGHTVFDLGVTRRLNRRADFSFTLDNLASRSCYETQNYFESRVSPLAPAVARIHGTPGYPLSAVAGVTLRFGGK